MILIDFGNIAKEITELFENESSNLDLFFAKLSAYYRVPLHKRCLLYTSQQDVQVMKAVYNKNDQNPYMVEVTFMDAPQQVHYYVYDDNRELQEIEKIGK